MLVTNSAKHSIKNRRIRRSNRVCAKARKPDKRSVVAKPQATSAFVADTVDAVLQASDAKLAKGLWQRVAAKPVKGALTH